MMFQIYRSAIDGAGDEHEQRYEEPYPFEEDAQAEADRLNLFQGGYARYWVVPQEARINVG